MIVRTLYWSLGTRSGIIKLELHNDTGKDELYTERSCNLLSITTLSGDYLSLKALCFLLTKVELTKFLRDRVANTRRTGVWRPLALDKLSGIIPAEELKRNKHKQEDPIQWKIVEKLGKPEYGEREYYISKRVCYYDKNENVVFDINKVWVRDLYDLLYFFNKFYPNEMYSTDGGISVVDIDLFYKQIGSEFSEPFNPNEGLAIIETFTELEPPELELETAEFEV